MKLPYTMAEADHAHDAWNFMCGHFSIAAATGCALDQIHTCGVAIKTGGWMNPTMISETLRALPVSYNKVPVTITPEEEFKLLEHLKTAAILRIQWEGTWLNPGVPAGAAYQRTHYIAYKDGHIMDPALGPNIHMPVKLWLEQGITQVLPQIKKATGYHFTHAWTILP